QAGFGGVVSFEVGTSQKEAWAFMDALQLISIATNIGDTRSMVTHPASTTHGRWSPEDRMLCGIGDNLVRLSVGLESLGDLQQDIDLALQIALAQKDQSVRGYSLLEALE
ncbi:MAG TPA: O-succinylhomoserine sulfhydrylase, partial [Alcaligenes faecalis]|nr:O-succinylhomoserine sulfhydrylase [Alcaligenes faecalis]